MKTKPFKILQLKWSPEWDKKAFVSYDTVIKYYGEVQLNDYKCVYEGEVPEEYSPKDVYALCNLKHPGYIGHSLSVSDIIVMDGEKLYVDIFGFVKL